MAATTTLKLPRALKARVATIARHTGRSAHRLMVEAIERHVDQEERMRAFLEEALAADRARLQALRGPVARLPAA